MVHNWFVKFLPIDPVLDRRWMNIQMLLTEQPNRVDDSMARCRLWHLESMKSRMSVLTSAEIVIAANCMSFVISTKMIFGKWCIWCSSLVWHAQLLWRAWLFGSSLGGHRCRLKPKGQYPTLATVWIFPLNTLIDPTGYWRHMNAIFFYASSL